MYEANSGEVAHTKGNFPAILEEDRRENTVHAPLWSKIIEINIHS